MRGCEYAWGKPDERKMRGETQKRKGIGAKFGTVLFNSDYSNLIIKLSNFDYDYHYD